MQLYGNRGDKGDNRVYRTVCGGAHQDHAEKRVPEEILRTDKSWSLQMLLLVAGCALYLDRAHAAIGKEFPLGHTMMKVLKVMQDRLLWTQTVQADLFLGNTTAVAVEAGQKAGREAAGSRWDTSRNTTTSKDDLQKEVAKKAKKAEDEALKGRNKIPKRRRSKAKGGKGKQRRNSTKMKPKSEWKDLPAKDKKTAHKNKACDLCKMKGHLKFDCPNKA